jgi:peptidyl-prolyl cis-trans isomerase SurA
MKKLLLVVFSFLYLATNSQTIFTFGNDSVDKEEFLRVYQKNNRNITYDEKSIREYLDLYINFKLKVKAAEDLGMDTMESFITELEGYRKQLAQPYLTSKKVTDQLIREAYERSQYEIKGSHILITCGINDMPKDTQAAYKKAMDIREKIVSGQLSFDSAAYIFSEDPSAKRNFGNLGYFTIFQMIYAFETGAYNTSPGQVSMPVRTQFGYHLIKVDDKRPARGEVKIAHIMVNIGDPNHEKVSKDEDSSSTKSRIYAIYDKLMHGADWDQTCREYSDDPYTNQNGGLLNWISSTTHSIPEEIKNAAFALKTNGEISQPIKTDFGWHIIKRLDAKETISFEEARDNLAQKIQRDQRSDLNRLSVIDSIKKANNFKEYPMAYEVFTQMVDSNLLNSAWKIDSTHLESMKKTVIFSLGSKNYSLADFGNYVFLYQTPQRKSSVQAVLKGMYKDFKNESVLEYAEKMLPLTNENFRNTYREYRDGILLFDLMEKKVWNKAVIDTAGLNAYYESHKTDHMWKERVDATIYICADKKVAAKAMKMALKGIDMDSISRTLNKTNALNVTMKKSKFERGENPMVDSVKWVKGIQKLSDTRFVHIRELLPAQPKQLNEAKGSFTSDYQNYLEKEWVKELRAKYPVRVNEQTVSSLIK